MVQKQLLPKWGGYWSLGAVTLAVSGAWVAYQVSNAPNQPSAIVQPAPIRAVSALGRVEPKGSVIKVSVVNARDSRVERLLVQEGDRVRAGQVIALLQGVEQQQAAIAEASQNVTVQQAKLEQTSAGTGSNSQIMAQEAELARLQAQRRTEIQEQQAAIQRAEVELRNARTTYNRYRSLYEAGAISAADLDNYRKGYETAQTQLDQAQAKLANTQETLSAQIEQATAMLQNLSEVRSVDLQVPQQQVEYAITQLNRDQAKLEDFYVRAPVAGQILKINTQVGEQVDAEEGIVDLGQTEQMYVIAEVYETDVPKLKSGQTATIVSENGGFADELQGTVEQVGLQIKKADILGTDPAADQNARVVEVKIRLSPQASDLVSGLTYMQVRVKINLDS